MLTLEDCIAFSGLTRDQLDAIACHEHLPPIVAAELAECALESDEGCARLARMLAEEVAWASVHHPACAEAWRAALAEFGAAHPATIH